MSAPDLVIERQPTPGEIRYLEDRLHEFNVDATGVGDGEWLAIFVREDHRVVAGLCGTTWGGCLEVRQLWVEASRRRRGLGTRLLEAAEREARRRGCTQAVLSTFSFQAPRFYARHGFETVAAVDDYPRGHRHLVLRKHLGSTG